VAAGIRSGYDEKKTVPAASVKLGGGMHGLHKVSAQALSDTIGAIYDCALDPLSWNDAIRRIVELCESAAGGLCVHDLRNVADVHLFEIGYTKELSDLVQKHYHQSPFATASIINEVGDVVTLAGMCPDHEWFESSFYRTVAKPFGLSDYIGLNALRTSGRVAALHSSRTVETPRYGEREVAIFKLLSPHICRTLAISDALDIRTLHSRALEATLDALNAGVYLVSRDGRVVYMNAAAERQIKTGNVLRVVNNRLLPADIEARSALAKAIDGAASEKLDGESGGQTLAIPDPQGTGYVAILLRLDRGSRKNIMAPFAASVAIFVQEPAQKTYMPGEAFAKLYGLTGGELRVLLALTQGLSGIEAANMLGISEPTVRTHLQNIFAKTGTSRQTDLLRLLQSTTPPASAA
jgi:DNA-binding CsgD family transcriptional regulator/PAS domain-containing protein